MKDDIIIAVTGLWPKMNVDACHGRDGTVVDTSGFEDPRRKMMKGPSHTVRYEHVS